MKTAYKVFNPDWTCRGMKYEVGKTYSMEEKPKICEIGYHYCSKLANCFNYYDFNPKNKVAEVQVLGDIDGKNFFNKECTNKIKIVREITWFEVLDIVNTGDYNTGNRNTGDYNTGNRNTGNRNTGNYNTGDYNTGNYNTGDYNTGNYNTGDYNTGNRNTGNYNTGNRNTGDYNTGDYNTGFFNTKNQPLFVFNKPTKITRIAFKNLLGYRLLKKIRLTEWVFKQQMSEKEKKENPQYSVTGGYLRHYTLKQACKKLWEGLDENERQAIRDLPNFDPKIFKKITGIDA